MANEADTLVDTGERMMPESSDSRTFWEHLYRYQFASQCVSGMRVLDVACGAGYGSAALLASGAESVVGVDVSPDACNHARRKYSVDAREGNAEDLPFGNKSFDVVVSFETIEHLRNPGRFVAECSRLLSDDGTLVISTPNKPVYDSHTPANPFHPSELDETEFLRLIRSCFREITLYSQSVNHAPWWEPRSLCAISGPWRNVRGFWRLRTALVPAFSEAALRAARQDPVGWIVGASLHSARFLNPYAVRRKRCWSRERASYLIAVARR